MMVSWTWSWGLRCGPFLRPRLRRQDLEGLATVTALSDVTFVNRTARTAGMTTVMSFACAQLSTSFHY